MTSDLELYYKSLNDMLRSGEPNFFTNSDRSHNAMVMKFFFENANSDINMYCGSMSVFKPSFYTEIAKEKGQEHSEEVKKLFLDGLKSFMSKDGFNLNVIVEDFRNNLFIDNSVNGYIGEGRIVLKTLSEDFMFRGKVEHFTVTSNPHLYRLETDKEKHEAICAINVEELSDSGMKCFEGLWGLAKEIVA